MSLDARFSLCWEDWSLYSFFEASFLTNKLMSFTHLNRSKSWAGTKERPLFRTVMCASVSSMVVNLQISLGGTGEWGVCYCLFHPLLVPVYPHLSWLLRCWEVSSKKIILSIFRGPCFSPLFPSVSIGIVFLLITLLVTPTFFPWTLTPVLYLSLSDWMVVGLWWLASGTNCTLCH